LKLQEYQAKQVFARFGVPVPCGDVATAPEQAFEIARRTGLPVMVKAQVLAGGRGKAGGIRPAGTPEEAADAARQILGMDIHGLRVGSVLVEPAASFSRELYLGMVVDRTRQRVVAMASGEGGIEIEAVAAGSPEKIIQMAIDPFLGLKEYQARELAMAVGLPREQLNPFTAISTALYEAFVGCDASLAEINPLVIQPGGALLALDAKLVLDDSALGRHPDLAALRDPGEETPEETEARQHGISYVKLDGDIGCMVNGAGLAMATMDIIKFYGGAPANFLDVGGGARADRVADALRIILADPGVQAVLLNIFGGITRCDEVAHGILQALPALPRQVPIVARLVGTNDVEGRRILEEAHLQTADTLAEGAQRAIAASRSRAEGAP
jgi:succinyl-CoA synthetase beta subunit